MAELLVNCKRYLPRNIYKVDEIKKETLIVGNADLEYSKHS